MKMEHPSLDVQLQEYLFDNSEADDGEGFGPSGMSLDQYCDLYELRDPLERSGSRYDQVGENGEKREYGYPQHTKLSLARKQIIALKIAQTTADISSETNASKFRKIKTAYLQDSSDAYLRHRQFGSLHKSNRWEERRTARLIEAFKRDQDVTPNTHEDQIATLKKTEVPAPNEKEVASPEDKKIVAPRESKRPAPKIRRIASLNEKQIPTPQENNDATQEKRHIVTTGGEQIASPKEKVSVPKLRRICSIKEKEISTSKENDATVEENHKNKNTRGTSGEEGITAPKGNKVPALKIRKIASLREKETPTSKENDATVEESQSVTPEEDEIASPNKNNTPTPKVRKVAPLREKKTSAAGEGNVGTPRVKIGASSKEKRILTPRENEVETPEKEQIETKDFPILKVKKIKAAQENKIVGPKESQVEMPKKSEVVQTGTPKVRKIVTPKENQGILPKEKQSVTMNENQISTPKETQIAKSKTRNNATPKTWKIASLKEAQIAAVCDDQTSTSIDQITTSIENRVAARIDNQVAAMKSRNLASSKNKETAKSPKNKAKFIPPRHTKLSLSRMEKLANKLNELVNSQKEDIDSEEMEKANSEDEETLLSQKCKSRHHHEYKVDFTHPRPTVLSISRQQKIANLMAQKLKLEEEQLRILGENKVAKPEGDEIVETDKFKIGQPRNYKVDFANPRHTKLSISRKDRIAESLTKCSQEEEFKLSVENRLEKSCDDDESRQDCEECKVVECTNPRHAKLSVARTRHVINALTRLLKSHKRELRKLKRDEEMSFYEESESSETELIETSNSRPNEASSSDGDEVSLPEEPKVDIARSGRKVSFSGKNKLTDLIKMVKSRKSIITNAGEGVTRKVGGSDVAKSSPGHKEITSAGEECWESSSGSSNQSCVPGGVVCDLCGRRYGKASLEIHRKQCQKRVDRELADAKANQNQSQRQRGQMPGLVCHICNRRFGHAGMKFHEPQCMERWQRENDALPRSERRPAPRKPDVEEPPINAGRKEKEQFEKAHNEAAYEAHREQLIQCPNCTRKFLPDRLAVHQKSCRPGNAMKPPKLK